MVTGRKRSAFFWSNNEIYLTDEDNGDGNHLYCIDLSPWIPTVSTGISENINVENIVAAPNPSNASFSILLNSVQTGGIQLRLFDLTGKMVRSFCHRACFKSADGNSGFARRCLFLQTGC
ncbi:MAG: T9SS type A sorting domain-containing protein [Saprospiraceae bacterium]|nr:T9SS type A sorting domain-containing protein [Candidatus Brachybacter algidus]